MKLKAITGIVLTVLLIGMLPLAFDIQPVKASGTIYIRADGSVEPLTANITSADNVTYYFTDNNYDEVVVERSNIIIDGNGYTLQGSGSGYGFSLTSISNVTIRNTNVKAHYGIWLTWSSNNTVSGNNVTTTGWGIMVDDSSNNKFFGNNITINYNWGVELKSSSNNVFRNNTITGISFKFRVRGSTLSHFIQDVDESNTVDGKPIYYLVNRRDMEVPSDAGYVALVNSTNIVVEGLELKGNGEGILLAYTTYSQITNNTITDNYESAVLYSSSNNTFFGNNITDNVSNVYLKSSSNNNTFSGNIIADTLGGVRLYESSNNKFYGNDIRNNIFGNMYLQESSNNIISGNTITNSTGNGTPGYGVTLYLSSNNTVSENNITNNDCGIRLGNSSNNKFYHNNFINNADQVNILMSGYANFWDDGYPSGGNYWSDYTGVDMKSGPGQDQPGSDGIGDASYTIDADNVDNYPLRNPTYGPPSPQTYRLKITTTVGGTTNPSTETHTYEEGTVVSVTAIPHTNYEFDYWVLDDPLNYSNPINVTMDSDHTLHAVFTYDVTIKAYCYTEGAYVSVSITMDGTPTPYTTPHTFTDLNGTHTFTVPSNDSNGHPFHQWSTGETSTTITVTTGGTYTAYYEPPPYDVTIKAYCHTEDQYVSVSISMDGSPTGYTTPHTFAGLTGTHTFTVPSNDSNGHPFHQWSTGETSTTITVTTGGTYTAYYMHVYVPGCDIYVTMGGKVDGQLYLYAQNYAPNCRIPYGGVAVPMPFPFFTRAPLLSPGCLLQNISFSPPIDVNNDTLPDIIQISKVQLNPIVHYVFVGPPARPPPGSWWRFTLVAPQAGSGVIFINPYMPGDVDCYTENDDAGVWWVPPSPLAGAKAAESGGFMTNVTGVFNPSMESRFPSGGNDSIPGTSLWGDAADGFGDGIPDAPGSSILMLPLMLLGDEYNATTGLWEPTMAVPMPLVLTTGVAYDHVASLDPTPADPPGECFLYCTESTEEGTPWDPAFTKVTYVCAWSNLLYSLNPDDDGDGVPDPDPDGFYYTVDLFYEYVEKKVRDDVVIADINCDDIVDIFDCVIIGIAYGSEDEGIGQDGIPWTADDVFPADANFDPRADLNCDGLIDIYDLIAVAMDFGKILDP